MKTYVSEKYGFALQYPTHWKVNDSPGNRKLTGSDIVFEMGTESTHEGISIEQNKRLTAIGAANRLNKKSVRSYSNITVGGEQGRKADLQGFPISYIFVRHGDFLYEFSTTGPLLSEGVIASVKFTK